MFDIGWPELLVVAVVLIVVVGPKDLPSMLRTFGRTTTKLRSMANDFRRQFDDALKEADMDGVSEIVDTARKLDPRSEIRKHLNPLNTIGKEIKADLDKTMKTGSATTKVDTASKSSSPKESAPAAGEKATPSVPEYAKPTPPATPAKKPVAGKVAAKPKASRASASPAGKKGTSASKTVTKTGAKAKTADKPKAAAIRRTTGSVQSSSAKPRRKTAGKSASSSTTTETGN